MLRVSCHPLKIETGRYKKIPKDLKICDFCNLNKVEDEYQMTMQCKMYRNLRDDFFLKYSSIADDRWKNATTLMEKFRIIMQPNNEKPTILICQFIRDCFIKRKMHQYSQ